LTRGIQDVFAASPIAQNGTVSRDCLLDKIVRPMPASTDHAIRKSE
jgi:hypothetical protein